MIFEFLYRGPTAQNGMKGAWHVVVGQYVDAFGEQQLQTKGPLTPSQAEALGFPLATILNEVAVEALKRGDAAFIAEAQAKEKQELAEQEKAQAIKAASDAIKERDEARAFALQTQKSAQDMIAEKDSELEHLTKANQALNVHVSVLMENAKQATKEPVK